MKDFMSVGDGCFRSHKRYYYHNQSTGGSQWEYPQSDIVGGDDAMDICTTPPPPEELSNDSISMSMLVPPPPPRIKEKSVTPPPPPVISGYKTKSANVSDQKTEDGEPLPPGVDTAEITTLNTKVVATAKNDELKSALDSFYSDLAAIDTPPEPKIEKTLKNENTAITVLNEKPVTLQSTKKKKTKVKIAQGLAMKKKGVSKLVEKWKNVQKNYD